MRPRIHTDQAPPRCGARMNAPGDGPRRSGYGSLANPLRKIERLARHRL